MTSFSDGIKIINNINTQIVAYATDPCEYK